jgi:hypothetical protein
VVGEGLPLEGPEKPMGEDVLVGPMLGASGRKMAL